ncbi:MAG: hypothetical protein OXU23_14315, partial [Candidatus Poribacteria bacterium]|nr:hypothetical protein [Candidatus Poribacteria bacterium]
MLCPFVRKRISFDIPMPIFPKRFKSTNKGWEWCEKHALAWKDDRRYTIFNIFILWLGLYGAIMYAAMSHTRIHMALMQFFIIPFLWFYKADSSIVRVGAKITAITMLLFGIINLLTTYHD